MLSSFMKPAVAFSPMQASAVKEAHESAAMQFDVKSQARGNDGLLSFAGDADPGQLQDRSANERQDKTALGIRAAGDDKHPC
jgi:hypothetical protein